MVRLIVVVVALNAIALPAAAQESLRPRQAPLRPLNSVAPPVTEAVEPTPAGEPAEPEEQDGPIELAKVNISDLVAEARSFYDPHNEEQVGLPQVAEQRVEIIPHFHQFEHFFCPASVFHHHRLYFEQPMLERYGHECGISQPAISTAHFTGSALILPFKMLSCKKPRCVVTPCPFH